MKKKGFTLVELLAVIALLGVLVLFAVPNVLKLFKTSKDETMITQEANVLDAANLFVNDYCVHPISKVYRDLCTSVVPILSEDGNNQKRYVVVDTLTSNKYIDPVSYGQIPCKGYVLYDKSTKDLKFTNGKAYLKCGDYQTDGIDSNGITY